MRLFYQGKHLLTRRAKARLFSHVLGAAEKGTGAVEPKGVAPAPLAKYGGLLVGA
jgi:hypothetical protein